MDNTSFAPFDSEMESYFDFDQGFSNSPNSAFANSDTVDPAATMVGAHGEEQRQVFNGPSFEYGNFRQLTGLPTGAVSNITTYNEIQDSQFNFNATPNPTSATMDYAPGIDFDMDFGVSRPEAGPSYFFPNNSASMVDPSRQMQQVQSASRQPGRLWPGMHSQQAEQAKAEALARQQRQQQLGHQIMQQRQQQMSRPGSARPSISQQGGQATGSSAADPVVEESISRLLDRMRHNSTVTSIEDDADSPNGDGSSRAARMRKEEEDMDDDERLLASEEGKKLSSKERRQLRNKVSARAFRSRRKEYIGQLEGEVAVKTQECNELRARNRNLSEQNQQLTKLTQTLLRHPAFNTFLNDMNTDPSILETLQQAAHPHQLPTAQKIPKQEAHDGPKRANMSQQSSDMAMMNLGNGHWNGNSSSFNYQQPQVFAVVEIPQPDFSTLSGKPTEAESERIAAMNIISKLDAPKLPVPSFAAEDAEAAEAMSSSYTSAEFDESEFALYVDDLPSTHVTSTISSPDTPVFASPKSSTIRLIVSASSSTMEQVNLMFDSLDPALTRLRDLTSSLSC